MTLERKHIKRIVKTATVACAILIVLGYAIFNSHDFFEGPEITILEPENGATLSTQTVAIRGMVERSQNITLNGKPILIDDLGNFSEKTLLFPGYNAVVLSAEDKFGRTDKHRLELIYKVN